MYNFRHIDFTKSDEICLFEDDEIVAISKNLVLAEITPIVFQFALTDLSGFLALHCDSSVMSC